MSNYKDLAGTEIKEGSFVVYAAALGRCAVLKYGVVTRLVEKENQYTQEMDYSIRILSADMYSGEGWTIQKKGKEITLAFFDRTTVVERLPDAAKKLLLKTLKERKDAASRKR